LVRANRRSSRPHLARILRRAYFVAIVCTVLLPAVYVLAVWTSTGQRLEDGVLAAAAQTAGRAEPANWALDSAESVLASIAIVAVVLLGLVRRRLFLGVVSAGVVGASILTTELLKRAALRPVLLDHGYRRDDQSFPSGHTVVATSVMCALVLVTPQLLRGLVALLASVWATSVAVATITAGWHRPSDTIGSDLIAAIYLSTAVAVLARRGWVNRTASPAVARRPRLSGIATVAASCVAWVAACAVMVDLIGYPTVAADGAQLIAGRLIASLGTALVTVILLALLYRVTLDPPPNGTGGPRFTAGCRWPARRFPESRSRCGRSTS
jgi:membrane-associated phospholipid phosphatase